MKMILVVGCVLAALAALARLTEPAAHRSRRAQCVNNLKQIAIALHNYHAAYNVFPPGYIADGSGRPMHSWRVLLLPYLDEQSLYAEYDFSEPWDGTHNIKLLGKMPRLFACPSRDDSGPAPLSWTSYVVVSGPGTLFPGKEPIGLDQVIDDVSQTFSVVEVSNMPHSLDQAGGSGLAHDGFAYQRSGSPEHIEQAPGRGQCGARRRTVSLRARND